MALYRFFVLLGGQFWCVENLVFCEGFGAYFCGVGLQNGESENPNIEESREKIINIMPINLLGTIVPDYPNNDQEICHMFSANYLLHRVGQGITPYVTLPAGTDTIQFLFNVIQRLNLQRNNAQIQAGDLIIIGNGRTANGAIVRVVHSMIAISPQIWFGCNNLNTFGLYFNQLQIPAETLFSRREVDLPALNINVDYNNHRFGGFDFDVLH